MAQAAIKETRYKGARGPRVYKNYTIGHELLADVLDEVRHLHESHWEETEGYLGLPFNPDYERMMELEGMYHFIMFTVRDENGSVVGNLAYHLNYSLHHKGHLIASEDAIFLADGHRRGMLAMELLKYAEEIFVALGVNSMTLGDKTPVGGKNLSPLMKRMGYTPIMTGYHKSLGVD